MTTLHHVAKQLSAIQAANRLTNATRARRIAELGQRIEAGTATEAEAAAWQGITAILDRARQRMRPGPGCRIGA